MSFWTPEREDRLRKLWADGLSASQIAADLGAPSRNAVIGKAHRLGLPGRLKPQDHACNKATKRVRRPRNAPGPASHQGTALAVKFTREAPAEPVEASMDVPAGKRCTIQELTSQTCRWPLWGWREDHGEYCGDRPMEGLPYCLAHCRLAYQPPGERKSVPVILRRRRAA